MDFAVVPLNKCWNAGGRDHAIAGTCLQAMNYKFLSQKFVLILHYPLALNHLQFYKQMLFGSTHITNHYVCATHTRTKAWNLYFVVNYFWKCNNVVHIDVVLLFPHPPCGIRHIIVNCDKWNPRWIWQHPKMLASRTKCVGKPDSFENLRTP